MGTTASGRKLSEPGPDDVVAVNSSRWPEEAGWVYRVLDGPFAGRLFKVQDHGPKAHFDIWQGRRADCYDYAMQYGRQEIRVERVA